MFFEIAPVLAWDATFAGDAITSSDDVLELEPPFLDDLVPPKRIRYIKLIISLYFLYFVRGFFNH